MAEGRVKRIAQLVSNLARGQLQDLRILDLGCREGGFSIELARRGAEVVGVEVRETHVARAQFAKEALGLDRLTVVQQDVREFRSDSFGQFDVVLCLGILYHLEAQQVFELTRAIAEACRGFAIVETQVCLHRKIRVDHEGREYWGFRFRENPRFPGNAIEAYDSFVPTKPSLLNLLDAAGFTSVCECLNPVIPPRAAYRDHVTLVAHKGQREDVTSASGHPTVWPENLKRLAHPGQGWRYAVLDRLERRRGGGLGSVFAKSPAGDNRPTDGNGRRDSG